MTDDHEQCSSCGSGEPCAAGNEHQADFESNMRIFDRLRKIDKIIVVLSGKGGVGKSTVAVNIAAALAKMGRKVGLLDVDIHGPTVPRMFGIADSPVVPSGDSISPVETESGVKVMSIAFFLKSLDAVIWRGPLKMGIIRQFLADVEWGELDYLIVDCPPGTGDEPLSVVQLLAVPANAIIVTTPQDVAVDAVRRSVTFCKQVGLSLAGIVENMSGFVCPHCWRKYEIFGKQGGEKLAGESGTELLGSIPISPDVHASGDCGKPPALDEASPIGKIYREIAKNLDAKLHK
ncbi:MAG: Mrp/NBP35 family ATP-binding protein [Candidatus Brocadiia bacterium]